LLERDFLDDDLAAAALLDDLGPRAQDNLAAAGAVAVDDALPAHDYPPGGEVGAGDEVHQLQQADVRVVDEGDQAVADFAEVVRRDFGGHADRDAVGAV